MSAQDSQRKRMSQSEILDHFASKTGLRRADVKRLFETLTELGTKCVQEHGEFPLPGFGKLVLSNRKARTGRNPSTGSAIEIPSKTVLKFRLGKDLKAAVSGDTYSIPTSDPVTRPDY